MINFEHFIEMYLYPVTLISGAVSFYIFSVLIAIRLYRRQKEKREEKKYQEIKDKILFHLTNPLKDLERILLERPDDCFLIAKIGVHLLRNLKGEAYTNLKQALESVGIYKLAFNKLSTNKEKMTAIELVAHWNREEVKDKLHHLLETGENQVKMAALESLAYLRDEKTLEKIIKNFAIVPVRSHLILSQIFQYFGTVAEKYMKQILEDSGAHLILKKAAILTLMKLRSNQIILDAVKKLSQNEDKEFKRLLFYALAKGNEKVPLEIIEREMKSDDWKIRQSIAMCASHSLPLPVKIIYKFMEDENWLVSLSCGEALHKSEIAGYNLLKVMSTKNDLGGRRSRAILEEREILYGLD
jgi:hypothetical protein